MGAIQAQGKRMIKKGQKNANFAQKIRHERFLIVNETNLIAGMGKLPYLCNVFRIHTRSNWFRLILVSF
jgi:hypothetical protein